MINLIRLRWWTLSKHDLKLGVLILPAACCWAFWSGSTALGSAPTGSPPGRWAPVWRRRRRWGRWAQRGGRSWWWWETCWATADSLFSASFIHHPLPPPPPPPLLPLHRKSPNITDDCFISSSWCHLTFLPCSLSVLFPLLPVSLRWFFYSSFTFSLHFLPCRLDPRWWYHGFLCVLSASLEETWCWCSDVWLDKTRLWFWLMQQRNWWLQSYFPTSSNFKRLRVAVRPRLKRQKKIVSELALVVTFWLFLEVRGAIRSSS